MEKTTLEKIGISPFKLATDNSKNNVAITDHKGTIIYANNFLLKNTGYKEEELIGRNIVELGLWGGFMAKSFRTTIWQTIKEGQTFTGEVANRRKNGARYIEKLSIYPIESRTESPLYVSLSRDITKEREIDRIKTDFIALASHQLRTPLSNMSLAIDLIKMSESKENRLTEKTKKRLNEIYEDIHDMGALIGVLLDVSKIQLGTFIVESRPMSIANAMDRIIDKFEHRLKAKRIRLIKKYNEVPQIQSDKNIVGMVLQNIISNAIKYTPKNGIIAILIRKENQKIKIKVKDTGYGIPKDAQDKIFSKFFRANNITKIDAQGVGMGLYLAKILLEGIKGHITFDSEENAGTTFHITLPLKLNSSDNFIQTST
ncbi:PAS domain-containing sensor histidine kinase [uncultured Desulfosarcina sp.]|uniref:PAS domain-containing sensor histidine kinase n=1 Tax=uncultured Desulfosarcina sp. TaxID=218289 RepID=UPI0029C67095|nr:PAS domain-containing sensor histidine kinase [uncultured Desulfosarcina sp.]